MDTSTKTVGYKEGSGFTHAYNDEPITFYPMEAHEGIRDVRNILFYSQPGLSQSLKFEVGGFIVGVGG